MATRFRRGRGTDAPEDRGGTATMVRPRTEPAAATPVPTTAAVARQRGREEFGGTAWGATLLGFLSSFGLAVLLVALLSAAGTAIGLTKISDAAESSTTLSIGGAVAILLALCVAYFIGGYAAGRMARFDGVRQGVGVWLWGLFITAGLGLLGFALGDQYNVLNKLDLPRLPVGDETFTTGGLITLGAVLLGTLLAAVAGGRVGEGFHRRVDRHTLGAAAES